MVMETVAEGVRKVFTLSGPDSPDMFCGTNIVRTDKMLILHGIPWLKDRLKEYGFTNKDGTLKMEMAQKLPWKGEPADPDSPKLEGDQKLRAQNLKGCAV